MHICNLNTLLSANNYHYVCKACSFNVIEHTRSIDTLHYNGIIGSILLVSNRSFSINLPTVSIYCSIKSRADNTSARNSKHSHTERRNLVYKRCKLQVPALPTTLPNSQVLRPACSTTCVTFSAY